MMDGKPFKINSSTGYWVDAKGEDSLRLVRQIGFSDLSSLQPSSTGNGTNIVKFVLKPETPSDSLSENYTMTVNSDSIVIEAPGPRGLFYGLQTLCDLRESGDKIPPLAISDGPRLPYRGMMLDVSRHFRSKEFVKKQIDAMARLKMNNLHLHLTDAAGWRLEIKRYPRLTQLAAWRKGETWKEWDTTGKQYAEEGSPDASGGYYTQDDIREIVAYAADRHINVIPEIEMPSHSEEVLTAYPELSCTGELYKQSDFCVGNDSVFTFIENVLTEVMELFPSKMIHIGGDEAPKTSWRTCAKCRKRMKAEGLKNVDELQSYMIHRIESFLNKNGRDLIGWDEIMEGGLAPNATVMSWRGTEGGEKAAASGHRVVMTPGEFCYLDSNQDAPYSQPLTIGGYLPIGKVYGYDPAPSDRPELEEYVYGVQGNLWCEHIPTDSLAEYQLWPRVIALAEIGWTPQGRRDPEDFRNRAIKVAARMKKQGYNVFDLRNEIGNRPEYGDTLRHLGYGAPVEYNVGWWTNYTAAGATTLTDGLRGGWSYNDGRWQGFLTPGQERVDVTIDLGEVKEIKYVGADFMQICGPDVWMPARVVISAGTEPSELNQLAAVDNEVVRDEEISFKNFAWEGECRARYIRYQAVASHGILFTDEIVIR